MSNPRTLQQLKDDPRVATVHWEHDGYGNTHAESERPSLWVGMEDHWYNYADVNSIHTKTIKEACRQLRDDNWEYDPQRYEGGE
jgi:hypothetical protein